MLKYLALFSISMLASLALTPLVRALALRLGAVDRPSERKIPTEPIPQLWRRTIQQVPVFGSVTELASVLERHPVGSVVISSEKIRPDRLAQALSISCARQIPVMQAHLKLEPIGADSNAGEHGGALSARVAATQPCGGNGEQIGK